MTTCDTVVICAELTELAPLVNRSWLRECLSQRHQDSYTPEDPRKALPTPVTEVSGLGFYPLDFPEVPSGILAVQSGVGTVNAARATTIAIEVLGAKQVLYSGTAGGLAKDSQVGEIIFGDTYVFHSADATVFGYLPGQLPGMPTSYSGDQRLLTIAGHFLEAMGQNKRAIADSFITPPGDAPGFISPSEENQSSQAFAALQDVPVRCGTIATGDSFITDKNVTEIRETFPTALAAEMESAAAAQVSYLSDTPFLAVRCISDLCSPDGQDIYHGNSAVCGAIAAAATICLLQSA
ncbi:phosphorylase family protein [Varibaculum timonense]|mgnify:FL=1|uniref:phosphorylase family protein n=1 Tax=Varibaculum timonense TaxID=1964383 RepID=UPI0022E22B50|nr:hypothetical protein [Varibaculum timonense]